MKNVFVGNMNFQTTEAELRALFEPFGQVTRVHIAMDRETGRARGFAFVEMPNDAEATKAMSGLDGKEVGGRALKVNEARPKAASGGGGPRGSGGSGGGGGLTATAIEIATAAAAAAGAEIPARVAGSRPRITATVPGSHANLAGNAQHVLSQPWRSARASTQGD